MKYNIIYADPPWSYQDKANAGKRGASHKYSCMTLADLMRLPIGDLAARDCLLAMWWVAPMPFDAIRLANAWGFALKTMKGFTWHKLTKNGADHFGMGNWTRANTEDCLFAVRGNPKRISASVRQLIHEKVREHSRKPDQVRADLVRLMGDVPRIELFARQQEPGWDVWGDQAPGSITLPGGKDMTNEMVIFCKCGWHAPVNFAGGIAVRVDTACKCGGREFSILPENIHNSIKGVPCEK